MLPHPPTLSCGTHLLDGLADEHGRLRLTLRADDGTLLVLLCLLHL